jgi:Amidohydrolase family
MRLACARTLAIVCFAVACVRVPSPAPRSEALADWHTHLSLESPGTLDSLARHGIIAVRDCGGELDSLLRWRQRIAAGTMVGPRLFIAGPLIDGPKPGAPFRLTVTDAASAVSAVDSLASRGVDFLKVHNAVSPAAFFALLRRARERGLPVAVHLPRGITAWMAVDSGASSIEHAAESLVASPIYAGLARTPDEALAWWRSPAGDSVMARWAARGTVVVPTLVRYEATITTAADSVRRQRAALLPELLALIGRMHRAGVRIAVGTDVAGVPGAPTPWRAVRREMELLEQAGLDAAAVQAAAGSATLESWFRSGRSAP